MILYDFHCGLNIFDATAVDNAHPFKYSLCVENICSSWPELVHKLETDDCKITQCLCTWPKAGSARLCTQYRSAVLK